MALVETRLDYKIHFDSPVILGAINTASEISSYLDINCATVPTGVTRIAFFFSGFVSNNCVAEKSL